jgi:hypothetical protein
MNKKLIGTWLVLCAFALAAITTLAHADGGKKGPKPPADGQETDPGAADHKNPPNLPASPPPPSSSSAPVAGNPSPSMDELQRRAAELEASNADLAKQNAQLQKTFDGGAGGVPAAGVSGSSNVVTSELGNRNPKIPVIPPQSGDTGNKGSDDSPGWWSNTGRHMFGPLVGIAGVSTLLLGIGLFNPWMMLVGAGLLMIGLIVGPILETYTGKNK